MPDNPMQDWIDVVARLPETQQLMESISAAEAAYVDASVKLLVALGYTVTPPAS